MSKKQRTLQDFLSELEEKNMTLADWARSNYFSLSTVYVVVNGRNLGKRGEGRRVYQAMGLATSPMHRNPQIPQGAGVPA